MSKVENFFIFIIRVITFMCQSIACSIGMALCTMGFVSFFKNIDDRTLFISIICLSIFYICIEIPVRLKNGYKEKKEPTPERY